MPLAPDQLPDDIAALKQLLLVKDAELASKTDELSATAAELAAAKRPRRHAADDREV